MNKFIILLCLLSVAGFMVQPSLSKLVPVKIHVVDGMTPVPKAIVQITGGDTDSGQTANSDGICSIYLDDKTKYDICASKGQQKNCIYDVSPTSRPIYIDIGVGGDSPLWNSINVAAADPAAYPIL